MYKFKKIPIILQRSQYECGITCLAMMFSWRDSKVSTSMFSEKNIGRDGVNAKKLKELCEKHEASFHSYKVNNIDDFLDHHNTTSPVMLHWNNNHYVVLSKVMKDSYEIIDPAHGKLTLSKNEFYESYSGYLFYINKKRNNKFIFQTKKTNYYKEIINLIIPYKVLLSTIIIMAIFYQLFSLLYPIITQNLVDKGNIVNSLNSESIPFALFCILLGTFLLNYFRTFFISILQLNINKHLTESFIEKIYKMPLSFFERTSAGDLTTRANNIIVIREVLTGIMTTLLLDVALILIYFIFLIKYSIILTGLVLLTVSIQLLFLKILIPKITTYTNQEVSAQTQFQTIFLAVLDSITYIKTLGNIENIKTEQLKHFENQLNYYKYKMKYSAILSGISNSLNLLLPLVVIFLSLKYESFFDMSLGQIIAFTTMANYFLTPFSSIFSSLQSFKYIEEIFGRVIEVLKEKDEIELSKSSINIKDLKKTIEIINLSFSYGESKIFENINLKIKYNDKILINGTSGQGKTTFFKVLSSLYESTDGDIFVDGKNLKSISLKSYRSNIGYITQQSNFVPGTILDNIRYYNSKITYQDIINACKTAEIYDDIINFPMGFYTMLSDDASNLSGGQRQRLNIARTLATNPDLLLIDEGTSNLDRVTEKKIIDNLFNLNMTILFISHRHNYINNLTHKLILENKTLKTVEL